MRVKSKAILAMALFSLIHLQSAAAKVEQLSPGYYDHTQQAPIFELRRAADRKLTVYGIDQIDIPGLSVCKDKVGFAKDEIRDFLFNEKHKELLLIDIFHVTKAPKGLVEKIDEFCKSLGYDRVVILGPTGEGCEVIKDSIYSNRSKQP